MATDRWSLVARAAAKRFGLFTSSDAQAHGVTRNGIASRVRSGDVTRVGRGIYRFTAADPSREQRLLAAILACGDGAVASHLTAAAVWTLGDLRPVAPFHVLVPDKRKREIDGVALHSSTTLDRLDVTVRGAMPVTTPWRTTVDACGKLSVDEGEDLTIEVMRRRMATPAQLRAATERMGPAPGVAGVNQVLRSFDPEELVRLMSWLEAKFLREIRRRRLPMPKVNRRITNEHGRLIGKVDFIWERANLVVEVDGLRWHSLPSQKRYDDDRQNALVLAGGRMLRFGAWKIERELDEVMATVAKALAAS
ncbi:MAG: type IV toxin-antitoxin system AbiEi family antitoxin domain-containing protein [Nitriliruptorales bacterium]